MCSDTRISYSGFSSDSGFKFDWAGKNMPAMIADNATRARELLSFYRTHLNSVPEDLFTDNDLRIPPQQYKRHRIEEYLQLRWGVSFTEYSAGVLSHLPEQEQFTILRDIAEMDLECQLIIVTTHGEMPRLFTVDSRGYVADSGCLAVIGSGSWLAHSTLAQRLYYPHLRLENALYEIYEAKKVSEREPSVGPGTQLVVIYPKTMSIRSVSAGKGQNVLQDMYWQYGPQILPMELVLPEDTIDPLESIKQPNATEDDFGSPEDGGS